MLRRYKFGNQFSQLDNVLITTFVFQSVQHIFYCAEKTFFRA